MGKLFGDRSAEAKEIINRGRKFLFIIILETLDISKKCFFTHIIAAYHNEAVFKNFDLETLACNDLDEFLTRYAILHTADF